MDRNNRPAGRVRRFGSGAGRVEKRGSGLGAGLGGPIGDAGGYSDRTEAGQARQTRSSGRGFGSGSPGGCLKPTGLGLVIVILAAVFFLYNMMSNGPIEESEPDDFQQSPMQSTASTSSQASSDKGAYSPDTAISGAARAKRTVLRGNGKDTATVMVYMCATDLESDNGMATSDLQEMLYADTTDNINIIVETGGTLRWQNDVISSKTNQRYRVTSEGLELLASNLGRKSMVKPETLSDFIRYCKSSYPADRYILVLWDHGGGSLTGYGYDQNFPNDSMTLDEIATALRNGKCSFDIVGFDACLMATLETAMVLEPYADYMIASEEVEPGFGWDYSGWLTALSKNTSISSIALGKKLIDDYVKDSRVKSPQSQATLSMVDLAEMKGTVPQALAAFAESTTKLIDNEQYKTVSNARAGAKEFAKSSNINQIDLIHFADNLNTVESKALSKALRSCIKYNRTSANITNSNGLSIFFPFGRLNRLGSMLETYDKIEIGDEYSRCVKSFASVQAGGQVVSNGSGSPLDTLLQGLLGGSQEPSAAQNPLMEAAGMLLNQFLSGKDFSSITGISESSLGWLDADRMRSSVDYYEANRLDASALKITTKGGQRVLSLSEEQWGLIQTMEMNVFIDDGKGFIDLGLDNVYEYNEDGDLVMEYDGTWLALNGNIVSYYMMTDDHYGTSYSITGRVPALLNDQLVDIIIVFDDQAPDGTVLGAQKKYDTENQTETVAKGLMEIVEGDKIDFLCDYYTYEGEYSDTYYLGDRYTATGEWAVENLPIGGNDYQMAYRITDIYNNKFWTQSVTD